MKREAGRHRIAPKIAIVKTLPNRHPEALPANKEDTGRSEEHY